MRDLVYRLRNPIGQNGDGYGYSNGYGYGYGTINNRRRIRKAACAALEGKDD